MRLPKALLPTLAVLVLAGPLQARLPLSWYQLTLNSGGTTNLFADSTGTGDSYGGLSLDLEQDLTAWMTGWYNGYGELWAQNSDLANLRNQLGVDVGRNLGRSGELWATAQGYHLGYRGDYSLYNRLGGSLAGGVYLVADPALRLRATGTTGLSAFPNADTLGVNYREQSLSIGMNASFNLPLSLDVEPGMQWRQYPDLANPAQTQFAWLATRATTPLDDNLGLVINLLLRKQLELNGDQIRALANGGLDAGDMLWDGWNTGVTLNHIHGPWRASLGAETGHRAYAETVIYVNQRSRRDDMVRVSGSLTRTFAGSMDGPLVNAGATVSYIDNSSTISYYAYSGFTVVLTLGIAAR